jgi:voltage-gated sodium channel
MEKDREPVKFQEDVAPVSTEDPQALQDLMREFFPEGNIVNEPSAPSAPVRPDAVLTPAQPQTSEPVRLLHSRGSDDGLAEGSIVWSSFSRNEFTDLLSEIIRSELQAVSLREPSAELPAGTLRESADAWSQSSPSKAKAQPTAGNSARKRGSILALPCVPESSTHSGAEGGVWSEQIPGILREPQQDGSGISLQEPEAPMVMAGRHSAYSESHRSVTPSTARASDFSMPDKSDFLGKSTGIHDFTHPTGTETMCPTMHTQDSQGHQHLAKLSHTSKHRSSMMTMASHIFAKEHSNLHPHHPRESMRMAMKQHRYMKAAEILVHSQRFDFLVCALIVVNAAVMGAEVDHQARNPTGTAPPLFLGMEYFFFTAFSLELALRLSAHGRTFFTMAGFGWNIFDTILVFLQWLDVIISTIDTSGNQGVGFARTMRVARMFRLIRVVRVLRLVHFIDELRKLLYLIVASFWSFIWAGILLVLLTYVFAIFFAQLVADYARDNAEAIGPDSPLFIYFGSTGDAVYSLYKALTGGADWEVLSGPLESRISMWLGIVFSSYIAFGSLVLLNLVTGVFVDGAIRLSKQDRYWELVKKVRQVFKHADSDSSGAITLNEFWVEFETDAMQELFALIEINPTVAYGLFDLLDTDHNGSLTSLEFVAGAINLQSPATNLELMLMRKENKTLYDEFTASLGRVEMALIAGQSHHGVKRGGARSNGQELDRTSSIADLEPRLHEPRLHVPRRYQDI